MKFDGNLVIKMDEIQKFIESWPVGPERKKSKLTPHLATFGEMKKRGCSIKDMHIYVVDHLGMTITYEALRKYLHRHRVFDVNEQSSSPAQAGSSTSVSVQSKNESVVIESSSMEQTEEHPLKGKTRSERESKASKYITSGNALINQMEQKKP